jgi:uncharacterized membrane protein YvlD (DUF360 family)
MSRLFGFYGEQLRVLWEWRGGPVGLLKRLTITLLVAAISFAATAWLLRGLTIDRFADAILAVILIALFNAIVRPVVLWLAAPISLILVAVLVILLQVVAFLVVASWAPGVHVDGFLTALVGSFIYAIINTVLTALLGVDSGDSYYGLLIQRLMIKRATGHSDKPGVVIIQIDGLAHPILAARMRAGSVNTLASWVRNGTHKLERWEAILPSMTSASQAGILHGNNDEIPAFRWYERDRQHLMASSNPADATLIVSRISNGEGLLSNNGASITNLVTGDATRSYLTTASIKAEGGGIGESTAFLPFFFSPSGYLRSFTMFAGEFIKELTQARRTRRSGVQPQMHRGMKYAGMRAASNVILRDVNVALIIEEMYRGTNVIYADFTDYDELAHHCGPERVESFEALDGVDKAIGTLVHAAENAPRPYKFIVLSDHGQSLGATFKQRYGKSLGEYIRELMGGRATVVQTESRAEGSMFVNAFLSEITKSRGVGPSVARAALGNRTKDGVVNLDAEEDAAAAAPLADESAIAVVGSGNLGLVWFTGNDHRLTVEELEELHPGLIAQVAAHPGVGLLMVRSKDRGAVVFGPKGTRYLDEDRVDGEDPTAIFGPHTVMSLKREDAMKHAPDLLLLSQYNPELGEVAAFEELIGSHGGLGGPQTEPFILHPVEWQLDEPVPLGAPAIYRNIRRWLSSIGIELGRANGHAPMPEQTTEIAPASLIAD